MAKKRMMMGGLNKAEAEKVRKAYKLGKITKRQYEKMPPKMLLGKVSKIKKKEVRLRKGRKEGRLREESK